MESIKNALKAKFLRKSLTSPIKFEDFFISEKYFIFFGFSFLTRVTNNHQNNRRVLFKISQILIAMLIVHLMVTIIIDDTLDVVAIIENLAFLGGYLDVLIDTVIIHYINREKIMGIIETLGTHFPHHVLDQFNFDTKKHLQILERHLFIFACIVSGVIVVYSSMPIDTQIYGIATESPQNLTSVFYLSFPFDQMQHGLYEAIYVYQVYITVFVLSLIIVNDMLFCSLVELTAMEFDIIADMISEIKMKKGFEAEKELKELLDIHQQLLGVVQKIKEIFSTSMFINIFGVTIVLCFSAFLCVVN